jgi:hypothetical protein
LVGTGIWTRLTDGYVSLHWSRVVLAGLIAFACVQMGVTVLVANLIRFHASRQEGSAATRIASAERSREEPVERLTPLAPRAKSPSRSAVADVTVA